MKVKVSTAKPESTSISLQIVFIPASGSSHILSLYLTVDIQYKTLSHLLFGVTYTPGTGEQIKSVTAEIQYFGNTNLVEQYWEHLLTMR